MGELVIVSKLSVADSADNAVAVFGCLRTGNRAQ